MKIKKIEKIISPDIRWNLHVEKNNNYIANGLVVSNCHGTQALVLRDILSSMKNAKYRFGCTGTLPDRWPWWIKCAIILRASI